MQTAITWFARNPVAANLLMLVLLASGVMALYSVNQEEFPAPDPEIITINVPYLGAAPEEVERSVCIPIEEAIRSVEGIDKLNSVSSEGNCGLTVQLKVGTNQITALNKVKSLVDGINSFPVETEKPIVSEVLVQKVVISIVVHGKVSERTLKEISNDLRDEIAALDGISQVAVQFTRPYEISIEVSEDSLRRYGLSLAELNRIVSAASLDMPGGSIKTEGGEVLLRTKGQAYGEADFAAIQVLKRNDGTRLTLGEIATIRDEFAEGDLQAQFNGEPAAMVQVSQLPTEDLIQMAKDVQHLLEVKRPSLPEGVQLSIWTDSSEDLKARLSILLNTATSGLILVLLILAAFLRFRLALWVAAGIPIALLGTVALFPVADLTISTMTVMSFILVLGILVDDAIVVGERVYAHEQTGKEPVQAAIDGTLEVSVPVIFGVLTTVAAFLPLVLSDAQMADFFSVIGTVVIIALGMSILESQLILPAHLAHRNHAEAKRSLSKRWNRMQEFLTNWLDGIAKNYYLPLAERSITSRYTSAAVGVGLLILAAGLLVSGRVIIQFFPSVEGDQIFAALEMPEGIATEDTIAAAEQLEKSLHQLSRELSEEFGGRKVIEDRLITVGTKLHRHGPPDFATQPARSHFAEVVGNLVPLDEREQMSAKLIVDRWRELTNPITDAVKLTFNADFLSMGDAIHYRLQGASVETLSAAAADLRAELARYAGVTDIADSYRSGKQEIQLHLLPEAGDLGLSLHDLAFQVRNAFYGAEVQRIQRGPDEVRVMIRFPESERDSISNLEEMYIRTPDGIEVPFYSVAEIELGRGFSKIERVNGQRTIDVIAEVNRSEVSPEEISKSIFQEFIPELSKKYPGIKAGYGGELEIQNSATGGLFKGFALALMIIFTLLAIPLKSYTQPLIIMSVIPFGIVGAVVGHWIMDVQLVFFSMLGIVALSGVVVNASLVLVDYVNRQRRAGMEIKEALLSACATRFRPILLTSTTTFVGLFPLMTTQTPITLPFLPMAVSLAFGVLFATFITLFLVPALYLILDDVHALLSRRKQQISGSTESSESTSHG